jgi:hypothetical protein
MIMMRPALTLLLRTVVPAATAGESKRSRVVGRRRKGVGRQDHRFGEVREPKSVG